MKTNIKQITVANDRLIKETVLETKEDKKDVEGVIKYVGTFIATTIKAGMMEGVMIPEFGKFKPKQKKLLAMKKAMMEKETGMAILKKSCKRK